jgi:hypothetical protein
MESDWKKFRAMVPMLRERYLAAINARVTQTLTDPAKTETERFWDALDEMKKEAKNLRDCLDGHSRSKMLFYLWNMKSVGMVTPADLADCSDQLKEQVFGSRSA